MKRKVGRKPIPYSLKVKVEDMYENGFSVSQIRGALPVGKTTIYKIIKSYKAQML